MNDWIDASGDSAVSMPLRNDSKTTPEELSKKSDQSSDIASKLLQGWTLLGQCCPVCVTPLVRNRQKQMYCVSCSQWVLTEEQLAEKLQAQHVKDAEATTIDSATPATAQPSVPTATSNGTETSLRNQAAATTVPHSGTREKSIHKQVTLPSNSSAVLSRTSSTLFQTLEELQSAIAGCAKSDKLHQLLVTTKECLDAIKKVSDMQYMFNSKSDIANIDREASPSQGFLKMMFGETVTDGIAPTNINTEPLQQSIGFNIPKQDETQPSAQKRARITKQKGKATKKGGCTSTTTLSEVVATDDEGEGSKRGPNWKEHWIINLIHLRGSMHQKFNGMKKQGVDNWGVLHTHLVAACPDFDRSSDACRKKWKKIYDDYKGDYTANVASGNDRSTKCKWYSLIDGYMDQRANVFKHVHASVPNEGEETTGDTPQVAKPNVSSSQDPTRKKIEKLTTQDAIAQMAEHSKTIALVLKEAEATKHVLLQGMLATMSDLMKKL